MRREVYTCDVCGITRTESNHWWLVIDMGTDAVRLMGLPLGFSIVKWDDRAILLQTKHVCGQECAHKLLSAYMEGQ